MPLLVPSARPRHSLGRSFCTVKHVSKLRSGTDMRLKRRSIKQQTGLTFPEEKFAPKRYPQRVFRAQDGSSKGPFLAPPGGPQVTWTSFDSRNLRQKPHITVFLAISNPKRGLDQHQFGTVKTHQSRCWSPSRSPLLLLLS